MTTKPQSTTEPTEPRLLPCPLLGHLPDKGEFTAGPYIAVSGAPNMPKFYAVVCPGCCSTAYDEDRERVIKKWNTRISPASAAPVVDRNIGVWFKAAVSGLWYTNHESAGDIAAVRVNGVRFNPAPESLCVCGHARKDHESYSDHDECLGCIKERNGLTEEHCSWFAAATAAPQVDDCDAARVQRLEAQMQGLLNSLATSQQEVERLRAGNFTPQEFQNLCHNLDESDREVFVAGCLEYQRKLFGDSAAPVEQSIDPIGDFVEQVWKLTTDRDGWSRITLRGLAETFARQFAPASSSTSARAAAEEIVKAWLWHTPEHEQERAVVSIDAIIERHS